MLMLKLLKAMSSRQTEYSNEGKWGFLVLQYFMLFWKNNNNPVNVKKCEGYKRLKGWSQVLLPKKQ